MNSEPHRFGPAARLLTRAGQAAVVVSVRLRGGVPEVATCDDVRRSKRKLREVSRAVHEELVGMEESLRRTTPDQALTPVAERFPGGWREVEPLVLAASRKQAAEARQ